MLTNLLPGLRDLRAPLASGYLWLVGLWLVLVDAVPPRNMATGVVAHVYALTTAVGHGAVLAAISFMAYLIGAVLSVESDGFVVRFFGVARVLFSGEFTKRWQRRNIILAHLDRLVAERLSRKVANDIFARISRARESGVISEIPDEFTRDRIAKDAIEAWNRYQIQIRNEDLFSPKGGDESDYWVNEVWQSLALDIIGSLADEIRQLVTELRVTSPPLFDQYDRERAEAEFRMSVAFPLTFVAAALAWKWTPLWLLLLVGVVLIMRSGLSRARQATDVVAQAALAGYVTPSSWLPPRANPMTAAQQALDAFLREERWTTRRGYAIDRAQAMQRVLAAATSGQPTDLAAN
jgi:hypothetical protein